MLSRLQTGSSQQSADGVGRRRGECCIGAVAGGIATTACRSYLEALSTAFAGGHLPRMNMAVMADIKRPAWRGPKRQPPQPEKEAQSLALLTDKGIISPDDAREQLES